MYKSLSRGDIELLLQCLDRSKKNVLDQSGDMKLLDSFRKLIDLLAAELDYNPPNPKIKTAGLSLIMR
jgi:hypothetical protein